MAIYIDQMGRSVAVHHASPLRIISLVPSQTELLYDLGLRDEIVGITKFCIHPESLFRSTTRVGGTKQFKMDVIASLRPTLIIGNKEENEQTQIEELMNNYTVWMSDITTLEDAYRMIAGVGEIVDKQQKANELIKNVQHNFTSLKAIAAKRAAYFIWYNPMMSIGNDTFINEMLSQCGLQNVFGHLHRYPEVTEEMLKTENPELILLSSEPYPFKEKHIAYFQDCCPQATIQLVDGEMFSWYGSRLLQAPSYFQSLLDSLAG